MPTFPPNTVELACKIHNALNQTAVRVMANDNVRPLTHLRVGESHGCEAWSLALITTLMPLLSLLAKGGFDATQPVLGQLAELLGTNVDELTSICTRIAHSG